MHGAYIGVVHALHRSLSWGGAAPSSEKLHMRAARISGAHLDELEDCEDGCDSDDEPWSRTPLQNALAVRAAGLPPSAGCALDLAHGQNYICALFSCRCQ